MAEVARNVDITAAKIKGFITDIKSVETELRALDKALKIDPSNVELVSQKYKLFEQQLVLNNDKARTLKEQMDNLKAELDSGGISQEAYEKNLKKLEQQSRLTEIEITRLSAAVHQQNEIVKEVEILPLADDLEKTSDKLSNLNEEDKKTNFSNLTKSLRDAKKEATNFLSAVGFLSSALTSSMNLVSKWGEMNTLAKVLGTLSIAATVAAAAMTIFHASWSLGIAVGAITAAVVAGVAIIKNASKEAGIDASDEIDQATGDMSYSYSSISTQRKEIDINVKLDTTGDTLLDQSNAYMMGGIIVDKLKKDLVAIMNNEMGGIVR